MIAGIGNGWSVQRADASRLAPELLPKVDGSAADADAADRREQRIAAQEAGRERRLGNELALQREQSRIPPQDASPAARPAADGAERAQTANRSPASAEWKPVVSTEQAAGGLVDAIRPADPVRAQAVARPGTAVAAHETEPADLNRDGALGVQELATYQAQQAETPPAQTEQQREAAERIAVQLARTYGRFDPEIANATLRATPFYTAA